jgi:hypothetical protein
LYWIEQVEQLIQRTLTDDSEIKSYILNRCYPGELAELSNPEYPLVCFKISPETARTTAGKFGSIVGRLDIWIWCSTSDPRLYTIFGRVKDLLDEQCLSFEAVDANKVNVVFYISEPTRTLEADFGTQVLLSTSTFKGLQL